MNRNARATRNNPNNKAFVSGGMVTNFTGQTPNSNVTVAPVTQPTPVPAPKVH